MKRFSLRRIKFVVKENEMSQLYSYFRKTKTTFPNLQMHNASDTIAIPPTIVCIIC